MQQKWFHFPWLCETLNVACCPDTKHPERLICIKSMSGHIWLLTYCTHAAALMNQVKQKGLQVPKNVTHWHWQRGHTAGSRYKQQTATGHCFALFRHMVTRWLWKCKEPTSLAVSSSSSLFTHNHSCSLQAEVGWDTRKTNVWTFHHCSKIHVSSACGTWD